jgi:hypothetical protein
MTPQQDGFLYTPTPNFAGVDHFTFRVTDSGNLSITGTATVTITADITDTPVPPATPVPPVTPVTPVTPTQPILFDLRLPALRRAP